MPRVEEIFPGLHKISLPLPMRDLSDVFVYLFHDGNNGLLVDSGWNSEECYERLIEAFSEIGFNVSDLNTILLSHLHPDHIGLASRLKKEAPNSKILMHARDAQDMVYTPGSYDTFLKRLRSFLELHGSPEQELDQMISIVKPLEKQFAGAARPDALLNGGEQLQAGKWNVQVLPTPGHTKGSVSLYERDSNILFSGDSVLPVITPNISLSPIYDGDPLGDYRRSLGNLRKYNPEKILPSHEFVFEDLGKRIGEIERHHEERLAEVVAALGEEKSGYEVAKELNWSIGSFEKLSAWQKRAAITETLAHLEYLRRRGKVIEYRGGSGDDERARYSKIAS